MLQQAELQCAGAAAWLHVPRLEVSTELKACIISCAEYTRGVLPIASLRWGKEAPASLPQLPCWEAGTSPVRNYACIVCEGRGTPCAHTQVAAAAWLRGLLCCWLRFKAVLGHSRGKLACILRVAVFSGGGEALVNKNKGDTPFRTCDGVSHSSSSLTEAQACDQEGPTVG